jgi:CheY-like chemotaxis protein
MPNDPDRQSKPMVLMVDDDLDTREMYVAGLSLLGLTVVAAGDAHAAFDLACEVEPDVIVTDVWLPGSDGYALAHRLQREARTRRTPVLIVTGWAGAEHAARARRAGCAALLEKPCPPDVLFGHIVAAMSTGSPDATSARS